MSCAGPAKSFTITINPSGQVNQPANIVACNGETTSPVTFTTVNTGGSYEFAWTSSVPPIGLPSSGVNPLPSFTAINLSAIPITSTITVTPVFTSAGVSCTGPSKTFTITVNPSGQVNQPANVVVCNSATVAEITFTSLNAGGVTTYSWTNSDPTIGQVASGTGNIPAFTAINTGVSPKEATITVTPFFTNGGAPCQGTPVTFTITVNPTGEVSQPANMVVCNGQNVVVPGFATNNTGGITSFTWTNSNPSVGFPASGNGNIPAFPAINTGMTPELATITVTPTFENGGVTCTGTAKTFTITVNPSGMVNQQQDLVFCEGSMTSVVVFTTPTTGGTPAYNWVNSDPLIGLPAAGTGNIPSFMATNTNPFPLTSTITVIPQFSNGGDPCDGNPMTFSITINPKGQVEQPMNEVACNGATVASPSFITLNTGGTTDYSWVNSDPAIGLTGSGSGNIPTFTAINNGTTPVTATITVTPTFTNGGVSCIGTEKSFTITIEPTPVVNQPSNIYVCNNEPVNISSFTTPTVPSATGVITYYWTNDLAPINLNSSGWGDIPPFTATNSSLFPMVANLTVTPYLDNGTIQCIGDAKSFTITVYPSGVLDQPVNQVVCHNGITNEVAFTSPNTGGTVSYSWQNDKTSIGLAAGGNGPVIPAFVAYNAGLSPEIATITVTPTFHSPEGNQCVGNPVSFTITVNPLGHINPVPDQFVCHDVWTPSVIFNTLNTGGITSYQWTNSNQNIGLGASGNGNLPAFIPVNTGNAPISSTITVIPTYEYQNVTCTGNSIQFDILVNPSGQVNQPADLTVCDGDQAIVDFTSLLNTGGVVEYEWKNTVPGIGLPETGQGNLNFPATNGGPAPIVAHITVTPFFVNGTARCEGDPKSFSITVNPQGQINQPENQMVCEGDNTIPVVFATNNTFGTTTYSWTNDTPGIGLPSSGDGNIPAFLAENVSFEPVTATIIVTPSFLNNGVACDGPGKTFTITVNPEGQVNQPENQTYCHGDPSSITFSTNNTTGTTNYTWTNSNPAIGLPATGTADPTVSFTPTNTGPAPIEATITVTPWFTNGTLTCDGPTKQFTITVKPAGQVNNPENQALCHLGLTNPVNFTTSALYPPNVMTYHWVNDNPSIGLGASGTGNIPPFIAYNTGTLPVTATITVTPYYGSGVPECPGEPEEFTITVHPLPVPILTGPAQVCAGSTGHEYTTAINMQNYAWSVSPGGTPTSGGTSTSNTVTVTWNTPGPQTVSVNYSNENGCRGAVPFIFNVEVLPLPDPVISGLQTPCLNQMYSYTTTSTGSDYFWETDGTGTILGTSNPYSVNVKWNSTGTHWLSVTYEDENGCSPIEPKKFFVNVVPHPVPIISGPLQACVSSGNVGFSTETGKSGYVWSVAPDGTIQSGIGSSAIQVFWSTPGPKTVSVSYLDGECHSDTASYTVYVNSRPVPSFPAGLTNNVTPCLNQPGMVYSTQPGMNNYIWGIAGGTITAGGNTGDNTATVTWTGSGQQWISVKYTDPTTGCESIEPVFLNVNVKSLPAPTVTGPATACLNSTGNVYVTQTGMTDYVWTVGDGTITQGTGTNIIHVTWTSSGQKQVCVTYKDGNGCEAASPGGCFNVTVSSQPTPAITGDISVCQKDIKTYSTQSGMTGYTWNVSAGNPILSGSGTNTITVQWFNLGNQTVAVGYNSVNNCPSSTTTKDITVKPLPFANFEADTVCLGTPTPFIASTTSSNLNYYWEFGNGQSASSSSPNTAHLYSNPGAYSVKLTVTGTNMCQKDTTKQILVLGKPIAGFNTSLSNCAEDSVSFYDLSSTPHGVIVKWIWYFGDGSSKTITAGQNQNIKHKYDDGGNYPVKLFIKTSDSCTAEITQQVPVNFSPAANFFFDAFACEKSPFQFYDDSQQNGTSAINDYSWNFGDPPSGNLNFSTLPDPTHSYTSSGDKSVLLLITNSNGCHDSIRKTVNVKAAPFANFEAEVACEDTITKFEDLSTPAAPGGVDTWLWNFGDPASGFQNTSTLQNPEHNYSNPGTYLVTLLVTNSTTHCSKDTSMYIVINQKPVAMFEYDSACNTANTQFTDISVYPGSPFQQRLWNFGDPNCLPANNTSIEQNPRHIYSLPGTYQVTLKIKNLNGCTDSVTLPVTVKPRPTALFSYESVFCDSAKVYFFDQSVSAGAGIAKREWNYASSIFSTDPNPTYTFPQPNMTYNGIRLIVTDKNSCSDTIIQSVDVKPPFRLGMVFDTVCFGQPSSFYATNPARAAGDTLSHFVWNFGDEQSGAYNTSDEWGPTHVFTEPGLYYVSLTATNSDKCTQTVIKPVRVHPAPEPDFTWQTGLTTAVTFNYDLTTIGENVNEIWWNFGDGTPDEQDILKSGTYNHTFPTGSPPSPPPPYNVCMKVKTTWPKDIPCEESKCSLVDIQPVTVGFTIKPLTLCDSVPVVFKDISTPRELIQKWEWDFDDPDGKDPKIEYTNTPMPPDSVTYVYTLKYNQPGLRRPKLTITTVTGLTKVFTYPAILLNPTSIVNVSDIGACRNDTVRFVLSDTSELFINNYHWEFGDNEEGENIWPAVHKYKYQGIYNPTLTTTNSYGCTYTATAKVTLGLSPKAAMLTNDPICERSETTLYDESKPLGGKIVSWQWNLNDEMTASTQNVSYTFHSKGQKNISLVVTDVNHCSDTVDATINVMATPVGKFTVIDNYNDKTGQVKMNNLSEESDTIHFMWDFGNGYKSQERNPVTSYSNDGLYTIRLRTYYGLEGEGCEDNTSYQYQLTYRTLFVPNAFKPTSTNPIDRLFKPVGANLTQYHIQVFDGFGRLMWESQELLNGSPIHGWDGTYQGALMPQGNYVWRITATFAGEVIWEGTTGGHSSVKKTSGTFVLLR